MLHYIDYENKKGDKVRISDGLESQFALIDISGVSATDAAINTESTAGYDGSTVTNAAVGNRNIVATLRLTGDIESAKNGLYRAFKPGQPGTLFYKSDGWDVKIPCYTEKLEIPPMVKPMQAVISLLCPQPFWRALQAIKIDLQNVVDGFYFPLVLYEEGIALGVINPQYAVNVRNDGDTSLGMTIEFKAAADVQIPKLINTKTLEYIQLDAEMQAGDVITVCTVEKEKRVTLTRAGEEFNYFNALADGSTFLQLEEGDNEYQYSAEGGEANLYITIKYTPLYTGV